MDTLNQEIIALIKQLPKAESETPSVHGLTELELTCGKILDRLLIASGHGRPPIRIQIGDDGRGQECPNCNGYGHVDLRNHPTAYRTHCEQCDGTGRIEEQT